MSKLLHTFLFLFISAGLLAACAVKPAPAPTPTLDPARWKTYRSLEHNFSFAYPKAYDDRPICVLKEKQPDASSGAFVISMTNSDLKVTLETLPDPKDTDPQLAIDVLRNDLNQPQISMDAPFKLTVAGIPAMAQRYHLAYNKDGYLEYVFFKKNGILYTIFINTPASCDGYPDTPTAEEAFQTILSSFQIH